MWLKRNNQSEMRTHRSVRGKHEARPCASHSTKPNAASGSRVNHAALRRAEALARRTAQPPAREIWLVCRQQRGSGKPKACARPRCRWRPPATSRLRRCGSLVPDRDARLLLAGLHTIRPSGWGLMCRRQRPRRPPNRQRRRPGLQRNMRERHPATRKTA